ncbi:hypothetical protein HF086_015647 [Spodoptera exigua]|uniref:Uncharacterized protein n=1 Tax=Spodoptera exigua TaxID=7107 RepID=A0A922MVD7_SPOEX|nr:hypothetical protein HF086_015647 [Spodoptera exigua]
MYECESGCNLRSTKTLGVHFANEHSILDYTVTNIVRRGSDPIQRLATTDACPPSSMLDHNTCASNPEQANSQHDTQSDLGIDVSVLYLPICKYFKRGREARRAGRRRTRSRARALVTPALRPCSHPPRPPPAPRPRGPGATGAAERARPRVAGAPRGARRRAGAQRAGARDLDARHTAQPHAEVLRDDGARRGHPQQRQRTNIHEIWARGQIVAVAPTDWLVCLVTIVAVLWGALTLGARMPGLLSTLFQVPLRWYLPDAIRRLLYIVNFNKRTV